MVNRKPQLTGQNWFIVLNPLKSELERSKIAREIAKAFRIPADEAIDLVANTPIILLDNLNYSTAIQVKQYFCASVSDLIVSNDGALKRRCYRTVWPNPPSLTFLKDMDAKNLPRIEEEKLAEDEAIQEIRSWIQTENGFSEKDSDIKNWVAVPDYPECLVKQRAGERLTEYGSVPFSGKEGDA